MNDEPKNAPVPMTPVTPQAMLSMAVSRGDTALAEKLMDLQERWEARNARKAFEAAIAAARAELPVIFKNNEMNMGPGRTGYRYEDMASISRAIDPILGKYGLGYRFRTAQDGNMVRVTCIIVHQDGHSEENTLSGPPDTSGSKNAIQSIGSTVTYLQRYTLKAALGIAASKDDDGTGGGDAKKRLPKKDARDIYTKFQAEVDALKSRAELEKWEKANAERIAVLPEDWEDILLLRIQERRLDLARAAPAEPQQLSKNPVRLAGTLCGKANFQNFLGVKDADGATQAIYDRCDIGSRAELAENYAAHKRFDDLVAEFRVWERAQPDPAPVPGSAPVSDTHAPPETGAPPLSLQDEAREAAMRGREIFQTFWTRLNSTQRGTVQEIAEELRALMAEADAP